MNGSGVVGTILASTLPLSELARVTALPFWRVQTARPRLLCETSFKHFLILSSLRSTSAPISRLFPALRYSQVCLDSDDHLRFLSVNSDGGDGSLPLLKNRADVIDLSLQGGKELDSWATIFRGNCDARNV